MHCTKNKREEEKYSSSFLFPFFSGGRDDDDTTKKKKMMMMTMTITLKNNVCFSVFFVFFNTKYFQTHTFSQNNQHLQPNLIAPERTPKPEKK